jgi:hypothetical protein
MDSGMAVVVVVDPLMMEVTQRDSLVEIGLSSVAPGFRVMKFAPREGSSAAVGGAGAVHESEGGALGFGEQPGGSTEVELGVMIRRGRRG